MSYSVNLGCWGSIFAVPTAVVDKYLKIAGSAQLKVLLWILRHSGEQFELDTVAKALNMDTFDVNDCLEFWISFDVLQKNGNELLPPANRTDNVLGEQIERKARSMQAVPQMPTVQTSVEPPVKDIKDVQSVRTAEPIKPKQPAVQSVQTVKPQVQQLQQLQTPPQAPKTVAAVKESEKPSATVVARPLRPDPVYVAKRVSEDKEIEFLLNEAQYIMGRPISPNENAGLLMLHDNDGLPCEVILMLLQYGVTNQKGMKQLEAMGSNWAKDGVFTVQAADEKIRELEQSKEAWRRVQSILGLEFRKPTSKEAENSDRWVNEWKFSDSMIKAAYDICVNAKGKYIPNYVNTILGRWHSGGITTVEQVQKERAKAAQSNAQQTAERKSSFDIDDLKGLSMFND